MKSNIVYILFFLLINTLSTFSQNAQIQGNVTDGEGKPAPFVAIRLKEVQKGTNSDENGQFIISNLKADTYTLVASYVGFKTLTRKIKLEEGKTLNLSLELFENAEMLKEIIVRGYISQNDKVVSVGKIAIKPMDLPQSIVTIDKSILDNQQVLNMKDVLMNTNGLYLMGTTGGYQEEIAGRGFAYGSSNTFKNGVRYFSGMMTELSGLERVEIMKGSAAILFGNVAAGGILNLVTKKPKFDFGGDVSMRVGSFGLVKPAFDVYGGLGKAKNVAFRLNGTYETANSFRQGVSSERFYVNPSLIVKFSKKTELLLESDYIKDRRTPDFGVGIINYKIVDIARERFLGVPWSTYKSEQFSTTSTLSHQFSEQWKLNFVGAFRSYKTDLFANTRPNTGTLIGTDGTWIRNIQRAATNEDYYLAQIDLTGKLNTGKVSHQLLFGTDVEQFNTITTTYNQLARYDTVNVFGTKQYNIRTDIPNLTASTLTSSPVKRFGVYVQDLICLNKKIKLLAGLRYSYQTTGSEVFTYSTNTNTSSTNFDGAFTPRLGLVYQPTQNHSIFASYANSFVLNTGIDIAGNALPPSLVDQYEVGVKNELVNGKVSVNLTAYRILNHNMAQNSLVNGNTYTYIKELAGSVQSEGIELDFAARPINGLNLMAGYSYNETKYIKSNTYIEGSLLKYNPNHTANASANYRFGEGILKGLTLGMTSVYIGKRYAGRSTRVQVANDTYQLTELPDYVQLDGMIGYIFHNISLNGKVGNIFNVLSYNVHDDNSVNPIAPRNYSLTLKVKF